MRRLLPVFGIWLGLSAAAFGDPIPTGDVNIAFLASTEYSPFGAPAFECQLGGGTAPCVIFSGTITDTDTDGTFITLASDPTLSAFSNYFTVDDTFFDTPGFYEGDSDGFVTSNTYGPGPIMGLDIAPGTPVGTYTANAIFAGFGGDGDPNGEGFTVEVPFTVVITPEPTSFGMAIIAGLLTLAASLRRRFSRAC